MCAGTGGDKCEVVFLMTNKHLSKRTAGRSNEDVVQYRTIREGLARARGEYSYEIYEIIS